MKSLSIYGDFSKTFIATFLCLLIVFSSGSIVSAEYEANDDFFAFLLETVKQHNLLTAGQAIYDQYKKTGLSWDTVKELVKTDLSNVATHDLNALAAIKRTYKNLTDPQKWKLLDFYNQVSVSPTLNLTIDANLYNKFGFGFFNQDVANEMTYSGGGNSGSGGGGGGGALTVSMQKFIQTIAMPFFGPCNPYIQEDDFGLLKNCSYFVLYERKYTFSQYVPGSGMVTMDIVERSIWAGSKPFSVGLIHNGCQMRAEPYDALQKVLSVESQYFVEDDWLMYADQVYLGDPGRLNDEFEVENISHGSYYVPPDDEIPSTLPSIENTVNNVFNNINNYGDTQYITINNSYGVDEAWFKSLLDIIRGMQVPTYNVTINNYPGEVEVVLPTPIPLDLSAMERSLVDISDILRSVSGLLDRANQSISLLESHVDSNFERLERLDGTLSIKLDRLHDDITALDKNYKTFDEKFIFMIQLIFLILILLFLSFIVFLLNIFYRFVWSFIAPFFWY